MLGYDISYKPKDDNARVLLNHTLFGRITYKKYRTHEIAYYTQGLLDSVRFFRLSDGNIFVEKKLNLDQMNGFLEIFGTYTVKETERNIPEDMMMTGEQYWKQKAIKKDIVFKKRFKKNE